MLIRFFVFKIIIIKDYIKFTQLKIKIIVQLPDILQVQKNGFESLLKNIILYLEFNNTILYY